MHSTTQRHWFTRLISCAALAAPFAIGQSQSASADVQFFEKKVRPVLVNRCYACHSAATKPAGGLRVDDRNGLLNGGDSGPAVVPGDPDGSLLEVRVGHTLLDVLLADLDLDLGSSHLLMISYCSGRRRRRGVDVLCFCCSARLSRAP